MFDHPHPHTGLYRSLPHPTPACIYILYNVALQRLLPSIKNKDETSSISQLFTS